MKRNSPEMDSSNDLPNKVALVERNVAPQGMSLVDPDAVVKSSQSDLIALAAEIQKADSFIKANTCSKLQVIAEQVRFLQKQAERILTEADQSVKLHHVACNFRKQPGHVYHLYERQSGQQYFSMLSPEEWGNSGPIQTFKGSYRLEHDQSWTPLSQTFAKDSELTILNKLLSNGIIDSTNSFKNITFNVD